MYNYYVYEFLVYNLIFIYLYNNNHVCTSEVHDRVIDKIREKIIR